MDNEATKVLNEQQNQNEVNETTTQQAAEKKGNGKGARVAGVAAGAAMGAGVAMGAERAYEAFTNDEEATPEETPQKETAPAKEAEPAPKAAPAEAKVEQKPEEAPKSEEEVKAEVETQDSHHDETAGGDGNAQKTATSVDADDEVHVVGVGVQDNGNGGVATVVAVQKGDDHALLVDVESDGRLDYAIHDDNGNGEIEDHEVHDVGNENISTVNVVGAYVEEARAQGVTPVVTDMETGQNHEIDTTPDGGLQITGADEVVPEDNYVDASDDMGDYTDTTDAGLMDV